MSDADALPAVLLLQHVRELTSLTVEQADDLAQALVNAGGFELVDAG